MNNANEIKNQNRFDTIDGTTLMSTPLTPFTPADGKLKRREALKKLAQGHKLQNEQEQEMGQKM